MTCRVDLLLLPSSLLLELNLGNQFFSHKLIWVLGCEVDTFVTECGLLALTCVPKWGYQDCFCNVKYKNMKSPYMLGRVRLCVSLVSLPGWIVA